MRMTYKGPGNSWNVSGKSKITGRWTQIANVSFRAACTFIKTHSKKK